MKNELKYHIFRKIRTALFAIILIIGMTFFLNVKVGNVYAANNVEILEVEDVDYRVEKHTNISQYRQSGNLTAPVYSAVGEADQWLFAGWYTDENCTTALHHSKVGNLPDGTYYAKYVSADVLTVKCQITANTTADSDKTVLRTVSSVDSLKYSGIGLELVTPDGTQKKMTGNTVNLRIKGKTGLEAFSYSPKVVDTESEYFFSATETIYKENFDKEYLVKPYWTTKDNTKVYGTSRCVTVSQGLANRQEQIIYIPVKMAEPANTTGYTTDVAGATVEYKKHDGTYAHFKITVADRTTLKSATKFVINQNDAKITTYIYRNLGTSITNVNNGVPTGDQTWYTVYNEFDSEEDEFVIVTNADLYGFAEQAKGNTFKDETIYLVSDIEVNQGYADPEEFKWNPNLDADGTTSITGTTNKWNKIGNEKEYRFAGTFDGQMHSISGIYMETTDAYSGLFGGTDATAKIKNFHLVNSFFTAKHIQLGSIVGNALGEFDTIYSDAVMISSKTQVGGMIGSTSSTGGITMTNCWFAGSVKNYDTAASYYGGLVGNVDGVSTINNCLNTGEINCEMANEPCVGGIVGRANKSLTLSRCLNKGTIGYKTGATNYGLLVGNPGSSNTTLSVSYSTSQKGVSLAYGVDNTTYTTCADVGTEDDIIGSVPLTIMRDLFLTETDYGYKCYWGIASHKGPVLSSFADYYEVEEQTAQVVDTEWYDSRTSTYTLSDMADFYGFSVLSKSIPFTRKTVKLSANITTKNKGTAEEWATTAPHYEWIGIGQSDSAFAGTFDGQKYNIKGIYMDTDETYGGLFCVTALSGVSIKNFSLTNSYFNSTKDQLGSIAGQGSGTFNAIYSDAVVKGKREQVGGLIGKVAAKSTMTNCWFNGSVTVDGATAKGIGGLVGLTAANTITNCLNSGNITATGNKEPHVGGLIGHADTDALFISYSMNSGQIGYDNAATNYYGLVVGRYDVYSETQDTISNTYTTAQNDVPYVQQTSNASCTVEGSRVQGADALKESTKDLFAYKENGKYNNYWAIVPRKAPVLSTFVALAEEKYQAVDTSWYTSEGGTEAKPYQMADVADFYGLAVLSKIQEINGFSSKIVKLTANIGIKNEGTAKEWATTAPDYSWPGIGTTELRFAGQFDGNDKTISGIYMNTSDQYTGLFGGTASTAQIKNFYLKESYFYSTNQQLGSIVGNAMGTFDIIYSNAIVESTADVAGGMIGATSSSAGVTMTNCWFDGEVKSTANNASRYGGLIGRTQNASTITDCLNTGTVSLTEHAGYICVGGLVGIVHNASSDIDSTTISNCLNLGTVDVSSDENTTRYGAIYGMAETPVIVDSTYSITHNNVPLLGSRENAEYNKSGLAGEKDSLVGYGALAKLPYLFATIEDETIQFESSWVARQGKMPMLECFAEAGDISLVVDVDWYDASSSEYRISNSEELYGFAWISKMNEVNGFSGKTVKLGADIELNSGNATNWGTSSPEDEWIGIGSDSNYFKGTFDGELKTISGVYLNSDISVGLFVATDTDSTVQKLRLKNSYFEASGIRCGSIAATGLGNFYMIYSDATVVGSGNYVGGLVGITNGNVVMNNCWFDGTVENTGTETKHTAGFVGRQNGGTLTLKNCLNSGAVSSKFNTVQEVEGEDGMKKQIVIAVGGFVGSIALVEEPETIPRLQVEACLNVGTVKHYASSTDSNVNIRGYGPIVGYSNYTDVVSISSTYATTESCDATDKSNIDVTITTVSENDIKGDAAREKMPELFVDNAWTSVSDKFPEIIFN